MSRKSTLDKQSADGMFELKLNTSLMPTLLLHPLRNT